jgi:hypothetical protein
MALEHIAGRLHAVDHASRCRGARRHPTPRPKGCRTRSQETARPRPIAVTNISYYTSNLDSMAKQRMRCSDLSSMVLIACRSGIQDRPQYRRSFRYRVAEPICSCWAVIVRLPLFCSSTESTY